MSESAQMSGLAAAATFFAVGIGISLGLCGASMAIVNIPAVNRSSTAGSLLVGLGAFVSLGFFVCVAGLLICGILALVKLIFPARNPGDPQ